MAILPQEIVLLVLVIVSATMHTIGVATPEWWILSYEYANGTVRESKSYGMWTVRSCHAVECSSIKRNLSGELAWLLGVAVIEVLSAVLYILAVVVATVSLFRRLKGANVVVLRKLFVVVLGGAGAVIILGILLFVKKKAGLTARQSLATKDGEAGWSLILSSIAGALGMIMSVSMAIILLCAPKQDDTEDVSHKLEYWLQKHKDLNEPPK